MHSLADELRRFNAIRAQTLPKGTETLREESLEQITQRAELEAELAQRIQETDG